MNPAPRKNIRAVIALQKRKGYKIFERPYELNIVGVRKDTTVPNQFDDRLYVFWKDDKNKWEGKYYTITTDPGTYWLKNPSMQKGTAILKEGQYKDSHKIRLHDGRYEALGQQNPVTVIRDYDRNAVLDFNNGKEDTGKFGINIHRASSSGKTKTIDRYSAGCQVFSDIKDFDDFMKLARKSRDLYGNNFTYTLIDERAYNRTIKRRTLYVVGGVLVGIAGWSLIRATMDKSIIPKFN